MPQVTAVDALSSVRELDLAAREETVLRRGFEAGTLIALELDQSPDNPALALPRDEDVIEVWFEKVGLFSEPAVHERPSANGGRLELHVRPPPGSCLSFLAHS